MRMRRLRVGAATVAVALTVTACGFHTSDSAKARASAAAAASLMARIQQGSKLVVGVEFNQPGIGVKDPTTGLFSGFDVEIANLIAGRLGVKEYDIEFREIVPSNRETSLITGAVDLVIASYSITDARRAMVGQAGPYLVTGQQLLVRKDDDSISGPAALKGKKVCAMTGSPSLKTMQQKYGAKPAPFATYTECVTQLLNKAVDAVTTDGAILLGYASSQPEQLKVVGAPFSTERYGIGFKRGDSATCAALRQALVQIFADGSWIKAFKQTLGKAGVPTPLKPVVDPTC